jgi:hypothetical protein
LLPEQKVAVNPFGIWISKPWRWWRGCKIFRVLGRALERWLNADTSDHDGQELSYPFAENQAATTAGSAAIDSSLPAVVSDCARAEESALRLRCD